MSTQTLSNLNIGHELLSFRVGEQEFCIDIMAVREIRGWTPTTALPHAPSYLKGVVNLRGTVMPVVDLAERLGLPMVEPTPQHVIIVAEMGSQIAGLLVNAVCDILTVDAVSFQPVPDIASEAAKARLHGLLTVNDRMIGLLRTDQLIPPSDIPGEESAELAA